MATTGITCNAVSVPGTSTVLVLYGGRDLINRSQFSGASARRCLRVYKKFFHVEVADMLSCGLGYATSRVASNERVMRAEPDWQKCKT